MPEFHSVLLYDESRAHSLRIWYFGFSRELILEDIRKRHTGGRSIWTQFKYCD